MVAIAMLVAGFVVDQNDRTSRSTRSTSSSPTSRPRFSVPERHANGKAPPARWPQRYRRSCGPCTCRRVICPSDAAPPPTVSPEPHISRAHGRTNGGNRTARAVAVNPELVKPASTGFIAGSRSSAAAGRRRPHAVLIVLQLFHLDREFLNEIWGVRRGRTWLMRIVFYWTVLTLGSLLFSPR